jgi:hypothetical protein
MKTEDIGFFSRMVVVTIAVLVCGWFLYWAIAGMAKDNRYKVNVQSQQYQAGIISQLRDTITGYDVARDPAQKKQLQTTFCALYQNLTLIPADLHDAALRICS